VTKVNFVFCRIRERKRKTLRIRMSPHTDCLGGYNLLERKIIEEKVKSLHDSSTSKDVLSPPFPRSRHENWKLARTKPGGQMTST